jgi:Zn-dependent protease with chaperone function
VAGPVELPGLELWTLAPFLVGQVLTWAIYYDAERAAYRAAHRLLSDAIAGSAMGPDPFSQAWLEARQAPPASFGGRWNYVLFQLRQRLALVFLPVLLLMANNELARQFPGSWQEVLSWLSIAALAAVFVGMPLLIRLVLGLKPLPRGVLRDRLEAAMKRLGFRCSDVLLWNTRSGMANAMVIGLVPWLRYVVFTDKLIEEFPEDEVEAVFGHEVGHIRHQHMLFYLLFLTGSMLVLGLVADPYLLPLLQRGCDGLVELFPWLPSSLGVQLGPGGRYSPLPLVLVMLAYVFVVFGFLSRRCERQADVFGCRAVSCRDAACEGHTEEMPLAAGGSGLCATGIRTFIRALEKVALVNGISRDRPGFLQSWQHSTIARRVRFLRRLLTEAEAEPAFQRRLWLMKAGLLAGMGALLAALLLVHGWNW